MGGATLLLLQGVEEEFKCAARHFKNNGAQGHPGRVCAIIAGYMRIRDASVVARRAFS